MEELHENIFQQAWSSKVVVATIENSREEEAHIFDQIIRCTFFNCQDEAKRWQHKKNVFSYPIKIRITLCIFQNICCLECGLNEIFRT